MLSFVVDPARLPGAATAAAELARAVGHVKASPPADPAAPVLVAGEPERIARAAREAAGVPVERGRPARATSEVEVRLELAIGDHELSRRAGERVCLPRALVAGPAGLVHDPALLASVPHAGVPYATFLRLPVEGQGVIVLLSPRAPREREPLDLIFQPVMANLARAITLCRDHEELTARLVAERDAARVGLERFRAALDTSGDVIAIIDATTGRLVDFNATAEVALGYARAELLARPATDVVPDLGAEREPLRALLDGRRREVIFEALHRRKDGTTFPVEVSTRAFEAGGGLHLQSIVRDLTEELQERAATDHQAMLLENLRPARRASGSPSTSSSSR